MKFKEGDKVNYHSIIGKGVTSTGHIIRKIGKLGHGEKVAWISGKSGCVSLKALSMCKED